MSTAGIMFTPVFSADAGSYRVTASNSQGQITGAATVTIIGTYMFRYDQYFLSIQVQCRHLNSALNSSEARA